VNNIRTPSALGILVSPRYLRPVNEISKGGTQAIECRMSCNIHARCSDLECAANVENSLMKKSWWLRIFRSLKWLDMVLAAGLIPFLVGRDLIYKKSSLAVLALLFTRKKRTTPKTLTEILGAYYCEVFKEYLRDDCTEKAPGVFYVKNEHILLYTSIISSELKEKEGDELVPRFLHDWSRLCVLSSVNSQPQFGDVSAAAGEARDGELSSLENSNAVHHSLNDSIYRSYLQCLSQPDNVPENSESIADRVKKKITLSSAATCYADKGKEVQRITVVHRRSGLIFHLPKGFGIRSIWQADIGNVRNISIDESIGADDNRRSSFLKEP